MLNWFLRWCLKWQYNSTILLLRDWITNVTPQKKGLTAVLYLLTHSFFVKTSQFVIQLIASCATAFVTCISRHTLGRTGRPWSETFCKGLDITETFHFRSVNVHLATSELEHAGGGWGLRLDFIIICESNVRNTNIGPIGKSILLKKKSQYGYPFSSKSSVKNNLDCREPYILLVIRSLCVKFLTNFNS